MDKKSCLRSFYYPLMIFLLLILGLSLFLFPSADDFVYSAKALEAGFKDYNLHFYNNINGRYTSTLMLWLLPLNYNLFDYYFIHVFALTALFILSLYTLLKRIFSDPWQSTIILSSLFFLQIYSLAEGYFWAGAAWTYTFPLVLTNFSLALLFDYYKDHKKSLLLFPLLFLMVGSNETILVMLNFILLSLVFVEWRENKKWDSFLIQLFAVCFFTSLIVVLAPSNSVRADYFDRSHDIVRTLTAPIRFIVSYYVMLINIPLILFIYLKHDELIKKMDKKYAKYLFLAIPLVLYVSFLPSYWGMGRKPNHRTFVSIQWYIWLLSFFFIPFVFLHFHRVKNFLDRQSIKKLTMVFVIGVLLTRNLYLIVLDLPKLPLYYTSRTKTFKKLDAQRGAEQVELDKLDENSIPHALMFRDVQNESMGLSDYFNINTMTFTSRIK